MLCYVNGTKAKGCHATNGDLSIIPSNVLCHQVLYAKLHSTKHYYK